MFNWFSNLFKSKSITRLLRFAKAGEEIFLESKIYKEALHFSKDVIVHGNENGFSKITGMLTIPKDVKVIFKHIIFIPDTQIKIEGNAEFHHCHFNGYQIDECIKVQNGQIEAYHCHFKNAAKNAVELLHKSVGIFEHCQFYHNGDCSLFIEQSQAFINECEFSHGKRAIQLMNHAVVDVKKSLIHRHQKSQIIVYRSKFMDTESKIERGDSSGLEVFHESEILLYRTVFRYHTSSQIILQNSQLNGQKCKILHGKESGLKLDYSEVLLGYCDISQHGISNVQASRQSRLSMTHCHIHSSKGFGVEASERSIINFYETIFNHHKLAQLSLTEKTICTMKNCLVKNGHHVGIFIEKESDCTFVNSKITENKNSAFNVLNGILTLINSEISFNYGNGIMALGFSNIDIDCCKMSQNTMPHIACKSNVKVTLKESILNDGKSIFATKRCEIYVSNCKFFNSNKVQIELSNDCSAYFKECTIYNGKSYGIKVLNNSNLSLYNSQISNHELAQLFINDSSVVLKNCELFNGKRNAIFIQKRSEVFIQDSYISKHLEPQIQIEDASIVELKGVQLTDGHHSDLLAQNQSSVFVAESMILNEKYRYNLQAVNHSKIELFKTYVENKLGEMFYSKNNSFIKMDK